MQSNIDIPQKTFILQLYNSLEKGIIKLTLQPGQTITIYLCGPTVYDHIHLGNLRPVIIFDVLHRLLSHLNIRVNYIQNITDIDDKIIAKAQKEGKGEQEISNHYTKSYLANLIRYNILFPTHLPRVTNYIPQIQNFIASLEKNGSAYQQEGEVFFRVRENQAYGKLSGQKLAKLKEGTREITNQANKEDNKDFLLWKKTAKGIVWNSPWGMGRPGWHTECSVFINEISKGTTIDIHGGGNDLLFPHHENERIQYLAHNNKELSRVWLHVAHIHWQTEKMSKSLGNVILAKHFYQKHGANVFRYLVLNSHYNQVINFSEELIQQAIDYTQKIKNFLKKLNFYLYTKKIDFRREKGTSELHSEVIKHLSNNLNTIKVLHLLEGKIAFLNKSIDEEKKGKNFHEEVNNFYFILQILGLKFASPVYNLQVKLLLRNWWKLREESKYSQADEIRKRLQELDIL